MKKPITPKEEILAERYKLEILCLECSQLCYLDGNDRWQCHNEAHNDKPKVKPVRINPCLDVYGKGLDKQTCKACIHLRYAIERNPKAKHWKCDLRKLTHGAATDHRVSWQSCQKYEKRLEPYHGG